MASKSPVSAASQQKVSSTPDPAPTTIPTSPQSLPPFPTPQTFDFLPPLHALLLRLLSSTSVTNQPTASGDVSAGAVATTGAGGEQGQTQHNQDHQQQQKVTQQPNNPAAAGSSSQNIHHSAGVSSLLGTNVLPPLEAKNLPTAASAIKIRIQKARAIVENMPDVDRSVDEQEQEIDELQERIAHLKSVIADFGRKASSKENDMMDTRV